MIADDPKFTACTVDKAFIWSHGRAPSDHDEEHLDTIHQAFVAQGATFSALVSELVASPTFVASQEASP